LAFGIVLVLLSVTGRCMALRAIKGADCDRRQAADDLHPRIREVAIPTVILHVFGSPTGATAFMQADERPERRSVTYGGW
jgi:hypothetical protein